jgi:hypothetical protein
VALIGHWKFDDNAASTTVVATVGSNMTLQGGENTADKRVAGPGGSIPWALDLDGVDDFITIAAFTLSLPWSMSIWVKFNSAAGSQYVFGRNNTSPYIRKSSNTAIGWRQNSGSNGDFNVPALDDDWHHLLITCTSGVGLRCFVDGVESSTTVTTTFSYPFRDVGSYNSGNFADISVAQLKLFDSDESANAATLYGEGVGSAGNRRRRVIIGASA